jgi:hypothetical protein
MNTYYLRCIEKDKPLLFALAQKLGLLADVDGVLTPQGCTWDEIGYINVPTGIMIDGDEVDEIAPTGKFITNEAGEQVEEYAPTGRKIKQQVAETAPSADKNGNLYWHINLKVTPPLAEIAASVYEKTKDESLGAALSDMARFFVADAQGQPIAPKAPARVFL